VDYKGLVDELCDDPEEDAVLKKTIANCNYGMLEKQINRTQKSKIFDTYEDAKFFQIKYGGNITFIKQYEERSEWRTESPHRPRHRGRTHDLHERDGPDGQKPLHPEHARGGVPDKRLQIRQGAADAAPQLLPETTPTSC
jgi:hypothetical protein